jgi:hypothetical protein
MPFTKIAPKAGLFTDGTRYSAQGTWYDSDKVRFRKGFAEKIGGWVKYVPASYLGTARKLHDWVTNSGNDYVGTGTNLKLYVNFGGSYYDITPIRTTATLGTDPIATVSGTAVITVTATGHGAVAGDYVTFAGSDALNNITAAEVNTEHRIVALGDPNGASPDDKFRVVCADTAGATDTAAGGSSITAAFQINTGLNEYVEGSGWGADTWGSSTWGSSATLGQSLQLRLWSMANFGDDMLANPRQGNIYYWDESAGTGTAATALSDITRRTISLSTNPITTTSGSTIITIVDKGGHGAGVGDTVTLAGSAAVGGITAARINVEVTVASTPTKTTWTADLGGANASSGATGGGSSVSAVYTAGLYYTPVASTQVMMSDVARHVIAIGCNPIGSTSINPLFVRWSSSENAAEWQPLSTNSAGGQELSSCSEIVGALMTREEILIWTDCGIVSMRYIGSPFYFSFTETAKGMSMISPNAAVNAGGTVYFMDRGAFYTYTGTAQRLVCPVLGTVFDDFDDSQSYKVVAGSNTDFSEVIWFYPSESGNGEIDKYVTFNYAENVWYTGTMERGTWNHAGTKAYPLASSIRERDLGNNPITTNATDPALENLVVTDAGHGLRAGDEIIFNNVPTVGGLSALVLNDQHTVVSVTDADTYTVTIANVATVDTGGGNSVKGIYPNVLYSHENGHDDDGSAMTAYIETGDVELGDGYQFWSLNRIIPDIQFRGGDSSDEVTVSLNGHNYPAQAQSEIASATITSATDQAFVRGRARQVSMKVESTGLGYGWRVGQVRLDGRTDGRR